MAQTKTPKKRSSSTSAAARARVARGPVEARPRAAIRTRARRKTGVRRQLDEGQGEEFERRDLASRLAASRSSQSRGRAQRTGSSDSKSTVGTIAEKAKGPALAGGAALVGLAGGLALTRKQKRKGVLSRVPTPNLKTPKVKLPKISAPDMPKPGAVVKAVGNAAGQVADGSNRLGQIAAEVQKASNAIGNEGDDR